MAKITFRHEFILMLIEYYFTSPLPKKRCQSDVSAAP